MCKHCLEIARQIDQMLAAELPEGEQWADSYRKDPAAFKQLITYQEHLGEDLAKVFKKYARRANEFITPQAMAQLKASLDLENEDWQDEWDDTSNDPEGIDSSDPIWNEFYQAIATVIIAYIGISMLGVNKVEDDLHYSIDWDTDSADLNRIIDLYAFNLVTSIGNTTKQSLSQALKTSLSLGESGDQLTSRIADIIGNDSRARRIARTETVRLYQIGQQEAAKEAVRRVNEGSKVKFKAMKKWYAQGDACDVCLQNDTDEWIKEADSFPTGDDYPPVHPNCRCDVIYEMIPK